MSRKDYVNQLQVLHYRFDKHAAIASISCIFKSLTSQESIVIFSFIFFGDEKKRGLGGVVE